mgnify:CR=1 FL=1
MLLERAFVGTEKIVPRQDGSEETTRAMVFTTLIFANIFLSLVNRSFLYSVFSSFRNRNLLFPIVIGATLLLLSAILYIPSFADFFDVTSLNAEKLAISILISAVSVLWFEVYKWIKRRQLR